VDEELLKEIRAALDRPVVMENPYPHRMIPEFVRGGQVEVQNIRRGILGGPSVGDTQLTFNKDQHIDVVGIFDEWDQFHVRRLIMTEDEGIWHTFDTIAYDGPQISYIARTWDHQKEVDSVRGTVYVDTPVEQYLKAFEEYLYQPYEVVKHAA
jgi:hypothetical protein